MLICTRVEMHENIDKYDNYTGEKKPDEKEIHSVLCSFIKF